MKTEADIEVMAEGGRILRKILNKLKKEICPGLTGEEIENLAKKLFKKYYFNKKDRDSLINLTFQQIMVHFNVIKFNPLNNPPVSFKNYIRFYLF